MKVKLYPQEKNYTKELYKKIYLSATNILTLKEQSLVQVQKEYKEHKKTTHYILLSTIQVCLLNYRGKRVLKWKTKQQTPP